MKRKFLLSVALLSAVLLACGSSGDDVIADPQEPVTPPAPESPWELVWEDDFTAPTVDDNVWSRITEGTPDWKKYQSTDDRCYEKRQSSIVFKGIVNDDKDADPRDYLCGGLYTAGKKAFGPGRIEVRARMTQARGAWPAIWMMPFTSDKGWPHDGEIDIMEHLNFDRTVYQTLHSGYIDVDNHKSDPLYSRQSPVAKVDEYHVYGVDVTADKIVFHIDGVETLTYPRMEIDGQYPFFREWDLRIDMQLGGSWVGRIDPSQLPVEMEVDWVRYYRAKK